MSRVLFLGNTTGRVPQRYEPPATLAYQLCRWLVRRGASRPVIFPKNVARVRKHWREPMISAGQSLSDNATSVLSILMVAGFGEVAETKEILGCGGQI